VKTAEGSREQNIARDICFHQPLLTLNDSDNKTGNVVLAPA